ncbi:hypothetical protein BD310DRAFT_979744 [Dichomitus squalens]|uniref:Uncharacterized protein n=1 Tax=Dichomitus squalens TaxID=114155 RepID=A0A4Q9PM81_9APHY|nr:hypothetical protein BD310DRAFT_979744 [Dichomitus squalens]
MRLLDTRTLRFVDFVEPEHVTYAILSHTWDPYGEQTFQHLCEIQRKHPGNTIFDSPILSQKVLGFCRFALGRGYDYGWVDSCCIEKTSSAELSEAINSMFVWYSKADACYAYLSDVNSASSNWEQEFRDSRWHRRGWTLQELIAPRAVEFLFNDWSVLGSKSELADLLEAITGVDSSILTFDRQLSDFSIARQEVLRKIPDQSIFAWGLRSLHSTDILTFPAWSTYSYAPRDTSTSPGAAFLATRDHGLLASSPGDFQGLSSLVPLPRGAFHRKLGYILDTPLSMDCSAYGMQVHLPVVRISSSNASQSTHVALLACEDPWRGLACLLLRKQSYHTTDDFCIGSPATFANSFDLDEDGHVRAMYISDDQMAKLQSAALLRHRRLRWLISFSLLSLLMVIDLIVSSDERLESAIVFPHMPVVVVMPAIAGFGLLINMLLFAEKDFTVFLDANQAERPEFYLFRQIPALCLFASTTIMTGWLSVATSITQSPSPSGGLLVFFIIFSIAALLFLFDSMRPFASVEIIPDLRGFQV